MSGAVSYLLDADVYDEISHAFDPDDLMQRAEVLNRTALSLFQNTLTPGYLRTMQIDASLVTTRTGETLGNRDVAEQRRRYSVTLRSTRGSWAM